MKKYNSLFYSKCSDIDVSTLLETDIEKGLTHQEAQKRLRLYGPNELSVKVSTSKITILIRQLKSIIVLLLLIAALISFFIGHIVEGFTVVAVLIINTALGFFTELKAIRSMEALKKIGVTRCGVIREAQSLHLNTKELVPGDIVLFEAGDILGADLRIVQANNLNVNESLLTGESVPVDKISEALQDDMIIAERKNILFKGTSITRGSGRGIVIATAMDTEVGIIAKEVEKDRKDNDETTPLEKRLNKLAGQIVWFSLVIAAVIAISGITAGKPPILMLETAIALAIATIPEGLPIVATLALAKGMWRMANNNALINKLAAVETLGATSIIFTDKTGTLTENKMTVQLYKSQNKSYDMNEVENQFIDDELKRLLQIGVLCNNSEINRKQKGHNIGDPMEIALLEVAAKFKIKRAEMIQLMPELKEVPFDSSTLMMATYHQVANSILVAVKGAPEAVLKACTSIRNIDGVIEFNEELKKEWNQENHKLASEGLRILALATKDVENIDNFPYDQLTFLGLVALLDPARSDVKDAIEKSKQAGIRTIMVTGDQEGTALKIAKDIGLIESDNFFSINGKILGQRKDWNKEIEEKINRGQVFSRVGPLQKLDLIKHFQEKNAVVAMTGDGVNDAAALNHADIGIAMGKRGTQIAKEASDMILQDDQFNTIILAIKQGRIIYSNIQRFVVYLLSCNISEILIVSIASLMNMPLPLLPLQILFLNLVTDVFPALALGMGEGDQNYLKAAPRPRDEQIITKRKWALISLYGFILTTSVLTGFFYTLSTTQDSQSALSVSFLSLGLGQVFHVFNMRLESSNILINEITKNIHVWGAVLLCIILLLATIYIPGLRSILNLKVIGSKEWTIVAYSSLAPLIIIQLLAKLKLGIRI
ncbi:cation-transporting P-type ATPase [Halobacteriovorax sp. DA5]|uniref:cation-translocating P-type ATPase n=1 Tax=Halobacteriovorax sp. DA5 TaxID=2067553 RepID=UPI000CCFF8B9|nr:cation-transporting P-type ATPase [Halobacteriovorax sp. DA5]POB14547.1 ATPase [Halobacteriovorax sp. DA5]